MGDDCRRVSTLMDRRGFYRAEERILFVGTIESSLLLFSVTNQGNSMKLTTVALASVVALGSTFAFAQGGGGGSGGASSGSSAGTSAGTSGGFTAGSSTT